jgi:hypothetical protein
MYIHVPLTIKELPHDVKQFSQVLQRYIQSNSFYSLEKYFDFNWKWVMLFFVVNHNLILVKWYADLNILDLFLIFNVLNLIILYYFYWQKFLFNFVCVCVCVCIYIYIYIYKLYFILLLLTYVVCYHPGIANLTGPLWP